jgi:hypothetical protein
MARIVLTNAGVVIGGVDLSDHVAQVSVDQSWDEVETTAFGDGGRTRVAGLEDSSITLSFHQDFAAASVDATISPLIGGTAAFEIYADGTSVSATNPKYSGTVLLTEWSGVSGSVGDLLVVDTTWPVSGTVTRATA